MSALFKDWLLTAKQSMLLIETANFYNLHNRNVKIDDYDKEVCKYYPINNNTPGCAIGRLIADKALCKKLDNGVLCGSSVSLIFDFLPESVKYYGKEFLVALQSLHDYKYNWNTEGLSATGKLKVEQIQREYNLYIVT